MMTKIGTYLFASAALFCVMSSAAVAQTAPATPSPAMQTVLTETAKLGGKPIETLTPVEARKQPANGDAVRLLMKDRGLKSAVVPIGDVTDSTIHANGVDIPIRLYRPAGRGPFPVLVYYHGGGWVLGDLNASDTSCRVLSVAAKTIVVSVGYRLAPEHPFPAPPEDAYAALLWAQQHAASFNGDPKRVSVGGESAGGNLAAVTAILARDHHTQLPLHQLLIFPVTNYAFDTASYQRNANVKPLNKAQMQWFFKNYLRTPADGASPYASPLRASLTGLPPATIITDDIDPLLDDGKSYADKLRMSGVPVVYREYKGVTHDFFFMGALVPQAKAAEAFAAQQLRVANSRGVSHP